MRTNVHSYDHVAFDVKNGAQVRFDLNGVDRPPVAGGELVDFVRTQSERQKGFL